MSHKMKKSVAVLLAALLVIAPINGSADWIGDFYNSAGAGLNVTQAQAISTQNLIGGSGGGFTWRVPTRSFHPLQITPPSIKSGCGGIDMYLGGFSFPNKEQFVQALRNYGQASLGYFFQLALKSMAPEIGATLDVINEIAQQVNQFGTNSCEAAQWTAQKLFEVMPSELIRDGSGYAQAIGQAVDWFDANQATKSKPFSDVLKEKYQAQYAKERSALTPDDIKTKEAPPEYNLVWYALTSAPTAAAFTDEDRYIIMSIIGPEFIVRSTGARDSTATVEVTGGPSNTLNFEQLVGIEALDGTSSNFRVIECDEPVLCLHPTESVQTLKSFAQRAHGVIRKLENSVITRTTPTLTAEESQLLRLTGQPLMKVASLSASTGITAFVAKQMTETMAYSAAVEAASALMFHSLATIESALQSHKPKLDAKGSEAAMQLERKIIATRELVMMKVRDWNERNDSMAALAKLQAAERAMYSNLNRMLAANAKYLRH